MMPNENTPLWYALQVRPRFEKVVARNLCQRGYEEYLPLYSVSRRWLDRIKKVELPLFPRYLFCKFDLSDRLSLLMTPGVESIVGIGKLPSPVSEAELTALRDVETRGAVCIPWPYANAGQLVSVDSGPLAGLQGTIATVKDSWRLVISVSLLQRAVAVEMDQCHVTPVTPSKVAAHPIQMALSSTLSQIRQEATRPLPLVG